MDLFVGGGVDSKRASAESGIEKYGWNGEIYGACSSVLEIEQVQKMNMHEVLRFVAYKRAEGRLKNPKPKNNVTGKPKRPRK